MSIKDKVYPKSVVICHSPYNRHCAKLEVYSSIRPVVISQHAIIGRIYAVELKGGIS